MKNINNRTSQYDINDIFLKRYSPRAMSGESITNEELMTLLEAGRWAPSSNNNQPWRFIYAEKNSSYFEKFVSLLADGNKIWCKNAAVLIVTISKETFDNGNPSVTHSFDTGAAWENIALQATNMGLIAHGMQGFDYIRVKQELSIPDGYNVEMMIAIGKPGKIEDLPSPLQEREKPSDRRPLEETIFEGEFKTK